jgi:acetyl-CoA synthetase
MKEGRDHWWHRIVQDETPACPAEELDAEHPLFILYTSGTTGKPKGIVHTTGGYAVQTYFTMKAVFDLKPDDVFWCTADVGWITGHSYIVYGPLQAGATVVIYEGAPDTPHRGRFWEMIDRHRVSIFYTAPTAIRAFMSWGADIPDRYDLSSLRLLGSVGEPINPEAWMWYHRHIGRERCPIVDTWWQTETGAHMVTGLPGITTMRPGFAGPALPGLDIAVVDQDGNEITEGSGIFVIRKPWPAMLRTLYGDDERYRATYWSRFGGRYYFTGDGAKRDTHGNFMILGRIDDVLNVSGHRIGTMEVESALVDHPTVAEAAVVGRAHEIKGQAVVAFVTLRGGKTLTPALRDDLKAHVVKKIGAIARPDDIFFTADLPKTRSGKIMRRLLRDIAEGRALGDTTTLADAGVVSRLKELYEDKEG